jgi:hypothetical protein
MLRMRQMQQMFLPVTAFVGYIRTHMHDPVLAQALVHRAITVEQHRYRNHAAAYPTAKRLNRTPVHAA